MQMNRTYPREEIENRGVLGRLVSKQYEQNLQEQVESKELRDINHQKEAKQQKLQRVNIEAIEFGWILNNNEGVKFLKNLSKTGTNEIFELRVIQLIVTYLWRHYNKIFKFYVLLPNSIFLVLFIIYCTWLHQAKTEEEGSWGTYYSLNFAAIIVLLVLLTYMLLIELFHIKYHKLEYFKSLWMNFSWISIVLSIFVVVSDLLGLSERNFIAVSSVSLFIHYSRLLYFAKYNKSVAYLSKMIVQVAYDSRYFLFVFLMSV
jgi:hypothetical protein